MSTVRRVSGKAFYGQGNERVEQESKATVSTGSPKLDPSSTFHSITFSTWSK